MFYMALIAWYTNIDNFYLSIFSIFIIFDSDLLVASFEVVTKPLSGAIYQLL